MSIHLEDLQLPFPSKDVKFRIGATTKDRSRGQALAYLDARAIQQRFDDVAGRENWKVSFRVERPMGDSGPSSVICRIDVKINGEWIAKEDGCQVDLVEASPDDKGRQKEKKAVELAVKGAYSDAEKRAAVQWGVGRYLYGCEPQWLPLSEDGKRFEVEPALEWANLPKIHELIPVRNALRRAARVAAEPGTDFEDLMGELVPVLGPFAGHELVVGVVERCVREILRRQAEGRRVGDVIALCRKFRRKSRQDDPNAPLNMDSGKAGAGLYVSGETAADRLAPDASTEPSEVALRAVAQVGGMSESSMTVLAGTLEARFASPADRAAIRAAIDARLKAIGSGNGAEPLPGASGNSSSPPVQIDRSERIDRSRTEDEEEAWVQAGFERIRAATHAGLLDSYESKLRNSYPMEESRIRIAAAIARRRKQLSRLAAARETLGSQILPNHQLVVAAT